MSSRPFSPVTAEELKTAVGIFRDEHDGENIVFASSALVEPTKATVKAGEANSRVVRLVGADSRQDGGFEAEVDVSNKEMKSSKRLGLDAQVSYNFFELFAAIELTRSNEEWLAAVKARGIACETEEDKKLIQIDPWPAGGYAHPSIPEGHRALRCIAFLREDVTDNGYARPIHGLMTHVDLTVGKVAYVEDSGVIPLPPNSGRYDTPHQETVRSGLKDLSITQPDGPSFEVDGYRVNWQGWEFDVSVHPVHGLVLHQLSLQGRPLIYRAALSDMIVPYGDSDPMHNWKHVLDASEYNLGVFINSLKLGCDCLGEIHYFDTHHITWEGKVKTTENSICMHEEDYGIQWKHHDASSQTTEVRRSRRLVISSIFTVGNYDYGFYWYLYLDGTIQMEIKLTGIVGVSAVTEQTYNPSQAPLIGEG